MYVTQPSFLLCMSRRPEFSNVWHTPLFFPMYVTQPRILWYMSHHPVFCNVCHTAQNSPMYVTHPSFFQCMSHSPYFSNVCYTTQFLSMYVTQLRILQSRVISGETNQIIKPSNHGFCFFLVYRCALGSYLQIPNLFVLRPIFKILWPFEILEILGNFGSFAMFERS